MAPVYVACRLCGLDFLNQSRSREYRFCSSCVAPLARSPPLPLPKASAKTPNPLHLQRLLESEALQFLDTEPNEVLFLLLLNHVIKRIKNEQKRRLRGIQAEAKTVSSAIETQRRLATILLWGSALIDQWCSVMELYREDPVDPGQVLTFLRRADEEFAQPAYFPASTAPEPVPTAQPKADSDSVQSQSPTANHVGPMDLPTNLVGSLANAPYVFQGLRNNRISQPRTLPRTSLWEDFTRATDEMEEFKKQSAQIAVRAQPTLINIPRKGKQA